MGEKPVQDPRKVALREDVDKRLASMTKKERVRQSEIIIQKVLNHPKYQSARRISLFLSLTSEVDTAPILDDILASGREAYVPQYGKGVMRMLRVLPGDVEIMPVTSWGIKQHARSVDREDALLNGGLDLVIAPGAAFTAAGRRCGHGGGYYDRYLTQLLNNHQQQPNHFRKPFILAVGFQQQIYDDVPVNEHDFTVDEVVTA